MDSFDTALQTCCNAITNQIQFIFSASLVVLAAIFTIITTEQLNSILQGKDIALLSLKIGFSGFCITLIFSAIAFMKASELVINSAIYADMVLTYKDKLNEKFGNTEKTKYQALQDQAESFTTCVDKVECLFKIVMISASISLLITLMPIAAIILLY